MDFLKSGESEIIEIRFQQKEFTDIVFIISEFETETVSSGENFPVKMVAEISENADKIWSLNYSMKISDGLPEHAQLKIIGKK